MRVVVAAAIAACASPSAAPEVRVQGVADTTGIVAWSNVGFAIRVGAEPLLPECPRRWYAEPRTIDCEISIGVEFVEGLRELRGTDALSNRDTRLIQVDTRIEGFALCVAFAHESGHILLDTPRHTAGGVMGGADCSLHAVDYELACEEVGLCL